MGNYYSTEGPCRELFTVVYSFHFLMTGRSNSQSGYPSMARHAGYPGLKSKHMDRFVLSNRQGTMFYGVIMVLGGPVVISTAWKKEAIIYYEHEIPTARKALIKAGIYSFRRIAIKQDELIPLDYQSEIPSVEK